MIRAALLVAILVVASPQYLSANPLMNSMNGLTSRLTSNEPGGFTSGLNQAFNGLTLGMADAARGFMAGNSSQQLYQPLQQQQLLQQQQQMYGQMPPPPPPHHGLFPPGPPPGHHHRRGPPGPPPLFGMMGQMDQYNPYQSMQQFSPQMNPQTQSYEMLTLQMRNFQLQQEYQRMQKHLEELLQRQYMNPQMYSNNNQLGQQQQSFGLPQNMQMNGQPQQQQQLQHQQQQQNGQNRLGLSQLYNGLRQYVPFGGQQQPQQDQLPLPNQPQQQQQQQQQQLPLPGQQQPLQQQLQQLQQPGQQPQQANNVDGRPASLPRSNTL